MIYVYENPSGDQIEVNFPVGEAPPSIIIDEDDEKVEYFRVLDPTPGDVH